MVVVVVVVVVVGVHEPKSKPAVVITGRRRHALLETRLIIIYTMPSHTHRGNEQHMIISGLFSVLCGLLLFVAFFVLCVVW